MPRLATQPSLVAAWAPVPAWSAAHYRRAVLTALGNDVGFDLVFARQLIARASRNDLAVAMSRRARGCCSSEAHGRGLYRRFAGYDGGHSPTIPMWTCFVVGRRVHQPGSAGLSRPAVGRR